MPVNQPPFHLFIVIEHAKLPSSRIRFVQIKPYLEKLGAVVELMEYPQQRREFMAMLGRMKQADLVILQKRLPNPLESWLIKRFCRRLVYDYDDAVRFRHLPRNGSYRSRSREVRFDAIIACADAVICGNEYLAGLMNRQRPLHIYPSPVPSDVPVRNYAGPERAFTLGWVGLGSNLNSLQRMIPALQQLSREMPLELMIISDRSLEIENVPVVYRAWSLEEQEKWISGLDIGLMPLDAESPYDRGKCSYKLLQYMASGVIPAADAVGMNRTVIRDGENGRLVYNGDWYPVLRELAGLSRSDRERMGRQARDTVLQQFDYPLQADKLLHFLKSV